MTRYAASQPYLFPPLFIVERMARVDHWVVMEEAQFDRTHVTVKLHNQQGPVDITPHFTSPSRKRFVDVQFADNKFLGKLERAVQMAYGKQDAYRNLKPWFTKLLSDMEGHEILSMAWETTAEIIKLLGLETKMNSSLALCPARPPDPSLWIFELGVALGADQYLTGETGKEAYLNTILFEYGGIDGYVQEFRSSMNPTGSVLDALFRHGTDAVRQEINARVGSEGLINMRRW
jgi:hypothetical protein